MKAGERTAKSPDPHATERIGRLQQKEGIWKCFNCSGGEKGNSEDLDGGGTTENR